jgi:hypothetical protein
LEGKEEENYNINYNPENLRDISFETFQETKKKPTMILKESSSS